MSTHSVKAFLVAALAIAVVTVACGGGDDDDAAAVGTGDPGPPAPRPSASAPPFDGPTTVPTPAAGGAAGGGQTSVSVTQALLDALPAYEGATLVREWLEEGNSVQVREYAVAEEPAQAADTVTRHFRDPLIADGWKQSEARASYSHFSKDGRSVTIGRVGPELLEPPGGATVLHTSEPPADSAFFFTLEAEE